MPGGRVAVRQSLYPAGDGGREELQGATVGAVELPGVWEGLGEGVIGCAPPNPTWHSKGGTGSGR